jgi:hypothetical protein
MVVLTVGRPDAFEDDGVRAAMVVFVLRRGWEKDMVTGQGVGKGRGCAVGVRSERQIRKGADGSRAEPASKQSIESGVAGIVERARWLLLLLLISTQTTAGRWTRETRRTGSREEGEEGGKDEEGGSAGR